MKRKTRKVVFEENNGKSIGFKFLNGSWNCKPNDIEIPHLKEHYNQLDENTFEIDNFITIFEYDWKDNYILF